MLPSGPSDGFTRSGSISVMLVITGIHITTVKNLLIIVLPELKKVFISEHYNFVKTKINVFNGKFKRRDDGYPEVRLL